jgi:DNA-binding PadR family transcriptional regulator
MIFRMQTMDHFPTSGDVALLGLLAEGPMHAWEITRQVEHREMRTWTDLGRSTVYKQLRSLEERGFVASAETVVAGRARRTYRLTDAGRTALAAGVAHHLAAPEYPHWAIDIATYNIDAVPADQAIAALDAYAATLRERAQGWAALEEYLRDEEGCPPHRWALARRARAMIEGELGWVAEFQADLRHSLGATRSPEGRG